MIHLSHSPDIKPVYQLLDGYSFDVDAYPIDFVIAGWLEQYGPVWVSHAITEALYQGRYKIISIEQILKLWQRRGQPIRHFNREFESIILGQALLCPTGYGDGAESQATRVSPLPPAPEPSSLTPTPAIAPKEVASATQTAIFQGTQIEIEADSAAFETQPPPLVSPFNPFDAGVLAAATAEGSQIIPNFRPLEPKLEAARPQTDEIQPFVPRQDGSELHQRLRAVVKGGMRE
jgi:hypothetical protein